MISRLFVCFTEQINYVATELKVAYEFAEKVYVRAKEFALAKQSFMAALLSGRLNADETASNDGESLFDSLFDYPVDISKENALLGEVDAMLGLDGDALKSLGESMMKEIELKEMARERCRMKSF